MIPCPIKRQGVPLEVLGERHGPPSKTDEEGHTPMRNAPSSVADHSEGINSPVTLPDGAPVLRNTVAFGDFVPRHPVAPPPASPSTQYTIVPTPAFEIKIPPPEERKGKGKQARVDTPTIAKCNRCGNPHTSKCWYSDKDCYNSCQGLHLGRCYKEGTKPGMEARKPGTGDKGKGRADDRPEWNRRGLNDEAQRYANQHPEAEQAWRGRTNVRKPGDKEGLKESDTTQAPTLSIGRQPGRQVTQCSVCNKPHKGDCRYQAQDKCKVCKGFYPGVYKERKYGQVRCPTQLKTGRYLPRQTAPATSANPTLSPATSANAIPVKDSANPTPCLQTRFL